MAENIAKQLDQLRKTEKQEELKKKSGEPTGEVPADAGNVFKVNEPNPFGEAKDAESTQSFSSTDASRQSFGGDPSQIPKVDDGQNALKVAKDAVVNSERNSKFLNDKEKKEADELLAQKNQQYYTNFDLDMGDLDEIEARVQELEQYIGIESQGGDMEYFIKNDIEKLDSKCIRLDDFVKIIEDKNFMFNDICTKYEQLENFLKNGNKFTSQCIDLSKRSQIVAESEEQLKTFTQDLKEVQGLEHYLNFQPVLDPKEKLEQLRQLDLSHMKQLIKSQENSKEIEELLTNYNDMVQSISGQIEYLDIITADDGTDGEQTN